MTRGIDEVQNIFLAILRLIYEAGGLKFDGDSPLALQIHIVQILFLHVTLSHQPGLLDETVSQGGFAVVNVSYNAEISY